MLDDIRTDCAFPCNIEVSYVVDFIRTNTIPAPGFPLIQTRGFPFCSCIQLFNSCVWTIHPHVASCRRPDIRSYSDSCRPSSTSSQAIECCNWAIFNLVSFCSNSILISRCWVLHLSSRVAADAAAASLSIQSRFFRSESMICRNLPAKSFHRERNRSFQAMHAISTE